MKYWVLLVGLMLVPVHAQSLEQVLTKAKQAVGGEGWDRIRTVYTKSKTKIGGFDTDRQEWLDVMQGRFGQRFELGPLWGGLGYDGAVAWGREPNKPIDVSSEGDFYKSQLTGAYRKSQGYFFPKRFESKLTYRGLQEQEGQKYQVVEAQPKGGFAVELWFDNTNYLLEKVRIVGGKAFTKLSDYRLVSGLKVPFSVISESQSSLLQEVQFNTSISDSKYAPPELPNRGNRKN